VTVRPLIQDHDGIDSASVNLGSGIGHEGRVYSVRRGETEHLDGE
jgi:hypothetical protein